MTATSASIVGFSISALCAFPMLAPAQSVVEQWRVPQFSTRFQFDFQNNICVDTGGPLLDFYAKKYDPRGNLIWEESFGSPLAVDHSNWLAVDAQGNIVLTGHRHGALGGLLTVKFGANGTVLWSQLEQIGAEGYRVEVDAADNIYVAATVIDNSARRNDFLTIKYDPDGNVVWQNQRDFGLDFDVPAALAVTPAGRVAVAGESTNDMALVVYDAFGNEEFGDVHLSPDGANDVAFGPDGSVYICGLAVGPGGLVVKYDADGQKAWTTSFQGPNGPFGYFRRLAVDSQGNIVAVGHGDSTTAYMDWLICKMDPAGDVLWGRTHDGFSGNEEMAHAVTVGPDDAIYVSGTAGTAGCPPFVTRGLGLVTIRYDADGNRDWIYEAPCSGSPPSWIAIDSLGELVVNGLGEITRMVRQKWMTLGGATPGTNGTPSLDVRGYLDPFGQVTVALDSARPQAAGVHVLGASRLNAPFAGGLFVPSPDLLVPFTTDPLGSHGLSFALPSLIPLATELTFQAWIVDPAAVRGLAASNAVIKGLQ